MVNVTIYIYSIHGSYGIWVKVKIIRPVEPGILEMLTTNNPALGESN